jgi:hypothetical protein
MMKWGQANLEHEQLMVGEFVVSQVLSLFSSLGRRMGRQHLYVLVGQRAQAEPGQEHELEQYGRLAANGGWHVQMVQVRTGEHHPPSFSS